MDIVGRPQITTGHPRMGGEHSSASNSASASAGSSPHGRGTSCLNLLARRKLRVIPAWAGNIAEIARSSPANPGHPRMGGEHPNLHRVGLALVGSSPHGRGTYLTPWRSASSVRVIPAWAGNICRAEIMRRAAPGHPRMGGEHIPIANPGSPECGSSPHGRGTSLAERPCFVSVRVIPAWAGNIQRVNLFISQLSGHPRMGGEHIAWLRADRARSGSSPHGRGTYLEAGKPQVVCRVIPAWAGNIVLTEAMFFPPAGHPRMGGEHYQSPPTKPRPIGSSPHGRGTSSQACHIP